MGQQLILNLQLFWLQVAQPNSCLPQKVVEGLQVQVEVVEGDLHHPWEVGVEVQVEEEEGDHLP